MAWELGQHPAIPNGWIVKPVLFGRNIRVLPECEGGHVVLYDEKAAHLIAAAPELLEALEGMFPGAGWRNYSDDELREEQRLGNDMVTPILAARAAIAKARGDAA